MPTSNEVPYFRVLAKASQDEQFRQRLLRDGKKAIQDELKITLPADVKVTVEEAPAGTIKLVLPAKRRLRATGELSDAELGQVAGGGCVPCFG